MSFVSVFLALQLASSTVSQDVVVVVREPSQAIDLQSFVTGLCDDSVVSVEIKRSYSTSHAHEPGRVSISLGEKTYDLDPSNQVVKYLLEPIGPFESMIMCNHPGASFTFFGTSPTGESWIGAVHLGIDETPRYEGPNHLSAVDAADRYDPE